MTSDQAAEALAAVFARWRRATGTPGLAWGLVHGGGLAASGGLGTTDVGGGTVPDADTVFRIASMTKSFTGAAVMTLVVDGRVRLDEPVATYVPELAAWRGPTADAPPLTVRHLVSMESGLPTDDAWADRHLDLPPEGLDELIATGASFAWTPGVRFEYSNLGWGLVGRVVERLTGAPVQRLVTTRLLEPLGMASTTWERPGDGVVAEPHRIADGDPVRDGPPLGDGTIAPMGGIWTTVRDLATWVGWFTDAFPPRDDPDDGPLPRWARREMQQLRRIDEVSRIRPRPSGPSRTAVHGYGIGLGIRVDERLGVSVGHSGGLPGYGSHMRWLPDHGTGVIALSNRTYGNMHGACVEALEVLADMDTLGPAHEVRASARFTEAAERAATLLTSWDDVRADGLLADNVGPDEPYERRAADAARIVAARGPIEVSSLAADTPLRGEFSAAGGLARVELGLDHADRVQWLDVTDRTRPSTEPIVVDEVALHGGAGTAYVIVRPVADLADAFTRWQGEVLDRLGGAPAALAGAHATLKAFGSSASPLSSDDETRIVDVVASWARACPPIELRAEGLHAFDEEHVPVVRLASTSSIDHAIRALWALAAAAELPAGYSDGVGVENWIPHLSLVYPREVDADVWTLLTAWTVTVSVGDVASTALEAEIVAYDPEGERRLGSFALGR